MALLSSASVSGVARLPHQRCSAVGTAVCSGRARLSALSRAHGESRLALAQPSGRQSTRLGAAVQHAPVQVIAAAPAGGPSANPTAVDALRRAHAKPAAQKPSVAAAAAATLDYGNAPGPVLAVHSTAELKRVLSVCSNTLVVLFCKARYCRSCKYFNKKFQRVAESTPGAVFLELVCDESKESFELMEELEVPALPHFVMYEEGAMKSRLSCTSEEKLVKAIESAASH